MKKHIIKIVTLLLIAVILIVPYIVSSAETKTTIINSSGGTYTLVDNGTVKITTYGPLTYAYKNGNWNRSILEQNDVFCIQPGAELSSGSYTVRAEADVTDNIKEYILSQTKGTMNINGTTKNKPHAFEPVQLALWIHMYKSQEVSVDIYDNLKATYETLINNANVEGYYDRVISDIGSSYDTLYNEAEAIYNEAVKYANRLSTNDNTLKLSLEGDKIRVDIGGSYIKSYRIIVNGTDTGKDYTGTTQYINIPNDDDGKVQIKVEINRGKIYTVRYRELYRSDLQNIWVVTYKNEVDDIISKTGEIEVNTDISLQKYITKVNGQDLNSNQTTLTNRKNTKTRSDETEEGVKNNIYKNVNATENYKYDKAVKIEVGDTVTYRVHVYNNSNINTKNVKVVDYLPSYKYKENNEEKIGSYVSLVNVYEGNTNITNSWSKDTTNNRISYIIPQLNAGDSKSFDITLKFEKQTDKIVENTAHISESTPKNSGKYRTVDRDYIQMESYAISLQKIVYSVNDNTEGITSFNRWDSWENVENQNIANNSVPTDIAHYAKTYKKYYYPVSVANGNKVTYAIKVANDGSTIVKNIKVKDTLPDGLDLNSVKIEKVVDTNGNTINNGYKDYNKSEKEVTFTLNTTLSSGEFNIIYLSATVTESNMSLKVLRNYAQIEGLQNQNGSDVSDSTPNNNQDADYIQMKDIIISGTVWNDIAQDKKQVDYNGAYDDGSDTVNKLKKEDKLSGIKVFLFNSKIGKWYDAETDDNGNYIFDSTNVEDPIKAIQYGDQFGNSGIRWAPANYNSYYIIFEYDGVTYTSTKLNDEQNCLGVYNTVYNDSNAKEDLGARTNFNDKFSTINNESEINYTTKNEEGYMPQSNHVYNKSTMTMQSSTNLINIGEATEEQLQHVNLGLRGRDIFDLELTTDVYSTKVTVNGVQGAYQYDNNKVTLRKEDVGNREDEDMANKYSESYTREEQSYNQGVRKTDINNEKKQPNLEIEVTYQITVRNISKTDGSVTKIIDYFDSKYEFIKAYCENSDMTIDNKKAVYKESGNGFKSVELTLPEKNLIQGDNTDTIEVYVVLKLNNLKDLLEELNSVEKLTAEQKLQLPTFNIAEITEYTTKCNTTNGQTQFTRGLIDKDSAPGSSNKEQVRLTTTEGQNTATTNGTPTTVRYYFNGAMKYVTDRTSKELNNLKYEDDTCAAPILYFTSTDYSRKVEGYVFEDKTTTNAETRIKTGNGKLDDGEVGIYGATVELIEQKENGVTYTTTTNKDGYFAITGFLPGDYIIKYQYGNTANTVLLHQSTEKENTNKQSYNGEDYQATNNTGKNGAFELNNTSNFWYVYNRNDKISTAIDNSERRNAVRDNVINFTDEEMTVLNNMRDMLGTYSGDNGGTLTATKKYNVDKTEIQDMESKTVTGINEIIEATKMYATTSKMHFTVEQTIELNELGDNKDTLIAQKKISVKEGNTDLGEWAIFPNTSEDSLYKEYTVSNMNFGIAEVPVTTIDLTKTVQSFTLKDATGQKVIASVVKNSNGEWEFEGNVLPISGEVIDVSVEDEKLQGARLQVTYAITSNMNVEKNFDGKDGVVATITGVVDYIDNNLSYNEALGENNKYWETTTIENVRETFESYKGGTKPQGTVDPEGNKYTTIVKAKDNSPILTNKDGTETATITLEKVLSSTDSSLDEIITSTVDIYEYNNTVEITGINYSNTSGNTEEPQRDRVRTPDRYIILPGVQHDYVSAETITIHPPTGDSSTNIMYYVIAIISLAILAAGAFGIKKFIVKK